MKARMPKQKAPEGAFCATRDHHAIHFLLMGSCLSLIIW